MRFPPPPTDPNAMSKYLIASSEYLPIYAMSMRTATVFSIPSAASEMFSASM